MVDCLHLVKPALERTQVVVDGKTSDFAVDNEAAFEKWRAAFESNGVTYSDTPVIPAAAPAPSLVRGCPHQGVALLC